MQTEHEIRFGHPMPTGYGVVWDSVHEMYFWWHDEDGNVRQYDGPYACRFRARRNAIAHSKRQS